MEAEKSAARAFRFASRCQARQQKSCYSKKSNSTIRKPANFACDISLVLNAENTFNQPIIQSPHCTTFYYKQSCAQCNSFVYVYMFLPNE